MKLSVALMLLTIPALAQPAQPSAGTGPAPAAVNTNPGPSRTGAAPVAGANSFSEDQARTRISSAGYSDIVNLARDDKGVWRGLATRDGKKISVSLDYQGNVVSQ